MYFYASLFAALIVTLVVVSKVAKMLLAKRYSMEWILLASLVGAAFAAVAYVLVSTFVKGVEPMAMLILSISVMFIASSVAFKFINKMSWSGAVTTNVASIAVGLIAVTAAVVLNGKSFNETLATVNMTVIDKVSMAQNVAEDIKDGEMSLQSFEESAGEELVDENGEEVLAKDSMEESFTDGLEPKITENQLIPPAALQEIKKREKKVYIEPKYRVISVGSIHSVVGKPIRVLKRNGKVIAGSLKKINGSDAYVAQRMSTGVATTPISIATIRKLEVYR
ncbi:MAG: hypothetical protein L3J51_08785 [Cocleimonas sp.]|nr:hypothetical protein [Cocleimonas sp.]